MLIEKKNKEDKTILKMLDELTIYNAEAVFSELVGQFSKGKMLELDLSNIEELDTCGFQMLYAFKKYSDFSIGRLHFVNHSDKVLEFIDLFGTARIFKDKIAISKDKKDMFSFSYGLDIEKE